MSKKSKKDLIVSFVLDETSSMTGCWDVTISGFNEYLKGLKDQGKETPISFSLVKFSTRGIEDVCIGAPIKEVVGLNKQNYTPSGGTPLRDAVCQTIKATAAYKKELDKPADVVFVIQTDGEENSSFNYSHDAMIEMIAKYRKKGWQFLFLGANIDAFSMAKHYGLDTGQTISYDKGDSVAAFVGSASNTAAFADNRDSGSLNYTVDQRAAVGDKHHKESATNFNKWVKDTASK